MKVGDETLGSVVTFRKTVLFSIQYKCFKTVIKIESIKLVKPYLVLSYAIYTLLLILYFTRKMAHVTRIENHTAEGYVQFG